MLCRRVSLEELHPALGGGAPETGLDIYCRGRTGLLADDGARWAVLILPGGGYERIAPAEGEPVALAFLAAGIQAFVLSYSVLPALWPRQFLEGAAALAWMRANAPELGFRPRCRWKIPWTMPAPCERGRCPLSCTCFRTGPTPWGWPTGRAPGTRPTITPTQRPGIRCA